MSPGWRTADVVRYAPLSESWTGLGLAGLRSRGCWSVPEFVLSDGMIELVELSDYGNAIDKQAQPS